MPLPGDLTTITVTASYPNIAGQPQSGLVKFDPGQPVSDGTGKVILTGAVTCYVFNGIMQPVILPCTDNANISPTNFNYKVTETLGTNVRSYYIQLPHTLGSTVDLSSLTPLLAVTSVAGYMPIAGGAFTGAVEPSVITLTDASVVTVVASQGNLFRLTLTGNHQLDISGGVDGQLIRVDVIQGAGGPWILSYSSVFDFGSAGPPTLSTSTGAKDVLGLAYRSSSGKWDVLAFSGGF
jgi:hypothetical protein